MCPSTVYWLELSAVTRYARGSLDTRSLMAYSLRRMSAFPDQRNVGAVEEGNDILGGSIVK